MAAAGALDLAAQFKIATDLVVVQDAETIHEGRWPPDPLHNPIGIATQIWLVAHPFFSLTRFRFCFIIKANS
jgi:hypothetical protein